jgi:hypothetical protein
VPFTSADDASWWVREGLSELPGYLLAEAEVLPEVPAELLAADAAQDEGSVELPAECGCCVEPEPEPESAPVLFNVHHTPDGLADRFAVAWKQLQQQTAQMWRAFRAWVSDLAYAL